MWLDARRNTQHRMAANSIQHRSSLSYNAFRCVVMTLPPLESTLQPGHSATGVGPGISAMVAGAKSGSRCCGRKHDQFRSSAEHTTMYLLRNCNACKPGRWNNIYPCILTMQSHHVVAGHVRLRRVAPQRTKSELCYAIAMGRITTSRLVWQSILSGSLLASASLESVRTRVYAQKAECERLVVYQCISWQKITLRGGNAGPV